MSAINNIFGSLPLFPQNDEICEDLLSKKLIRIERIVSSGQVSPKDFWYDQKENEWLILLEGKAVISFADQCEKVVLKPGDYLLIPAHKRHRVEYTATDKLTIWLAVFFVDGHL